MTYTITDAIRALQRELAEMGDVDIFVEDESQGIALPIKVIDRYRESDIGMNCIVIVGADSVDDASTDDN